MRASVSIAASVFFGTYRTIVDLALQESDAEAANLAQCAADTVPFCKFVEESLFFWVPDELAIREDGTFVSDAILSALARCQHEIQHLLCVPLRTRTGSFKPINEDVVIASFEKLGQQIGFQGNGRLRPSDWSGAFGLLDGVISAVGQQLFGADFHLPAPELSLHPSAQDCVYLEFRPEKARIDVHVPCKWGLAARKVRPEDCLSTFTHYLTLLIGYVHEHLSHLSLWNLARQLADEPLLTHGWLFFLQVEYSLRNLGLDRAFGRCITQQCRRLCAHRAAQIGQRAERGYTAADQLANMLGARLGDERGLEAVLRLCSHVVRSSIDQSEDSDTLISYLDTFGDWLNNPRSKRIAEAIIDLYLKSDSWAGFCDEVEGQMTNLSDDYGLSQQ